MRRLTALGLALSLFVIVVGAALTLPGDAEPTPLPEGKGFAFTILDDTDEATLENVRPVYELLADLGLRTTKTVWVLPGTDQHAWPNRGDSLADRDYREFILELQSRGFEIASHGARGGTSRRPEILSAMEEFEDLLGHYPRIHVNHFQNRDNVYWGQKRMTIAPYRWLYGLLPDRDIFAGDEPDSELFWADFLDAEVPYVVNFSFDEINLMRVAPGMPYHAPQKPMVNYWFHTSDGGSLQRFVELMRPENLDRLERERGLCIVYTHFGKGFYRDGRLDPRFVERMQDLASRPGWFAPASDLLDHLRRQQRENAAERSLLERLRIETIWLVGQLKELWG